MYSIVKVEIYSSNKGRYFVYSSHASFYIPPKYTLPKTREPEDKHCVLQCTCTSENVHDPIPLDKPKNHTALPYITWGLIQDSNNRRKESLRLNFSPDNCLGFQK